MLRRRYGKPREFDLRGLPGGHRDRDSLRCKWLYPIRIGPCDLLRIVPRVQRVIARSEILQFEISTGGSKTRDRTARARNRHDTRADRISHVVRDIAFN